MTDKLEVPRRRVHKDWHVGLHPNPMDRSHPDVNDDQLVQEATEMKLFSKMNGSTSGANSTVFTSAESLLGAVHASHPENDGKTKPNIKLPTSTHNSSEDIGSVSTSNAENGTNTGIRLLEDNDSKGSQEGHSQSKDNNSRDAQAVNVQNDEALESEDDSSFELFRENDELADEYSYDYDDYVDESM